MAATWCLTSEIAASKPELIHALLNGLQCRTYPPGVSIDWRDPSVQRSLDMQASTVTIVRGPRVSTDPLVFGLDRVTVGIKVHHRRQPRRTHQRRRQRRLGGCRQATRPTAWTAASISWKTRAWS